MPTCWRTRTIPAGHIRPQRRLRFSDREGCSFSSDLRKGIGNRFRRKNDRTPIDVGQPPGVSADEAAMRAALGELSSDDALFFCARINALVSGYSPRLTSMERQR